MQLLKKWSFAALIAVLSLVLWHETASAGFCAAVLKAAKKDAGAEVTASAGEAIPAINSPGVGRVGRYDVYDVQQLNRQLQTTSDDLGVIIKSLPAKIANMQAPVEALTKPRRLTKASWPTSAERAQALDLIREGRDLLMRIDHRLIESRNLTLRMADQILDFRDIMMKILESNAVAAQNLEALADHEIDPATRYAKLRALVDEAETLHINSATQGYDIVTIARQVSMNEQVEGAFSQQFIPSLKAAMADLELWIRITGNPIYKEIFEKNRRAGGLLMSYARAVEDGSLPLSVASGLKFIEDGGVITIMEGEDGPYSPLKTPRPNW